MMLTQLGEAGSWSRVFNKPNLTKFSEPTVCGVDYPSLGISQCWNDLDAGVLWIETHCATPSRRGAPTTLRITGLPDVDAIRVTLDGNQYSDWESVGDGMIELRCDIETHIFHIETGFRHGSVAVSSNTTATPTAGVVRSSTAIEADTLAKASVYVAGGGKGGCSCC